MSREVEEFDPNKSTPGHDAGGRKCYAELSGLYSCTTMHWPYSPDLVMKSLKGFSFLVLEGDRHGVMVHTGHTD